MMCLCAKINKTKTQTNLPSWTVYITSNQKGKKNYSPSPSFHHILQVSPLRSVNQSTNQLTNQPTNQPTNLSFSQSLTSDKEGKRNTILLSG